MRDDFTNIIEISYGDTDISSVVLLHGVIQRENMNAITLNIL